MLTESFYRYMAELVHGTALGGESLWIAVGAGDAGWDSLPPTLDRSRQQLHNELARLPVTADNITYLDTVSNPTIEPTWRIRMTVDFGGDAVVGTLRETGLFALGASAEAGSGMLLSYFTHARIDKTADMQLERQLTLDLQPNSYRLDGHQTRYLGNAISEELHDLENVTGACQIEELRVDRRHYFTTVEQARALGYDYCAFCFGRELSER